MSSVLDVWTHDELKWIRGLIFLGCFQQLLQRVEKIQPKGLNKTEPDEVDVFFSSGKSGNIVSAINDNQTDIC